MLQRSAILFTSVLLFVMAGIVGAQQGVPHPMVPPVEGASVPQEEPIQTGATFYQDYKRGWYWYEREKEKPKEQEGRPHRLPSLKDHTPEMLWNMHPDDFQALLMDFQKKAVMSPTESNVREYYSIQDIARRKSLAFANVTAAVMQKYPELSVAKDYPTATPGRSALTRMEQEEIGTKIREARHRYGLILFFSPTCQYCVEQERIVRYFEERYGWEVKRVDVSQETGLAALFNVAMVPTIILVYRYSQEPITISAGVVSLEDMEQRLYRGVRLLAGEISAEEYSLYDFQRGGAFDVRAPVPRERR